MLKVKAEQFHVSRNSRLNLWKVSKVGDEEDFILCPALRSVTGESITFYNRDGSIQVKP